MVMDLSTIMVGRIDVIWSIFSMQTADHSVDSKLEYQYVIQNVERILYFLSYFEILNSMGSLSLFSRTNFYVSQL